MMIGQRGAYMGGEGHDPTPTEEQRKLAEQLMAYVEFQVIHEEDAGEVAYQGTGATAYQGKCIMATLKLSEQGLQLLADYADQVVERVKAVAREHMVDGDYSRFEAALAPKVEGGKE